MGGGKKARGRTNRAKHEEAAAQKVANGGEPSAALREKASARRLPHDSGARQGGTLTDPYAPEVLLAKTLVDFVECASLDIALIAHSWMENEVGVSLAGNGTSAIGRTS